MPNQQITRAFCTVLLFGSSQKMHMEMKEREKNADDTRVILPHLQYFSPRTVSVYIINTVSEN